jgi:hypothetical protein
MDSCGSINDLLLDFGLSGSWIAQPAQPLHYQMRLTFTGRVDLAPSLASSLANCHAPFELETGAALPERYLYHPGLGIIRQQLNEAGEVLLREDAVMQAIRASEGNSHELERRLRLASGTTWLDLLETYRNHDGVRLLPKAV